MSRPWSGGTARSPSDERSRETTGSSAVRTATRGRLRPVDVACVLGVPTVLVVVFLLPRPIRLSLALSYAEPTVQAMYASHFVHLHPAHLLANLAVYLAVVPLSLLASVRGGRRSRFYVTFLTVLLAFPVALSVLNVLLTRPRLGFGFSGLTMAFLGFLPHALAGYLDETSAGSDFSASPLPFFVGTAVIAFFAVPPGVGSLLAGGCSLLGIALWIPSLRRTSAVALGTVVEEGQFPLVLAGACLFFLLPFAAFPTEPAGDGVVLNLFLHLLGFSFGYIVPYVTFQVASFETRVARSAT